ncbi:MAG TPA: DUF488 family protein [Myxococcaceae bacterium]|nr:DUF488 family protein [Myxococcaceae bacterium]
MIRLQRVYERGREDSGDVRFLVERLWPRGIKKTELRLDGWLRDVGPSTELRKWFSHDPDKWAEFKRRYVRELESHREAWEPILEASRRGRVTLLYSSRDTEHNSAVALKDFLEHKLRRTTPK